MKNRVFFSFVAISYVLCNSVFADDIKLDDVEVTQSFDDGYRAVSSDISKTRTPILEIPQTINVITNQQIKDKKPESLAESLANVSGVSYANSVGGIFDSVLKRGFGGNRDGSIMRNGVSAGVLHNFNATAQSVEVLKGPASVLYGIQEPGGVINITTKKPLYDFTNELWAGFGNHKYYNAGFDFTGPISDSGFAYRFIFDNSYKKHWREFGKYKNFTIAPSISYRGDDYRLDLAYTHTKYTDPVDRGMYLSTTNGQILPIDKKIRLDEHFNETNGKVDTFDVGFEKQIGQNWLLKANYAFSRSMYDYGQMRVMNVDLTTGIAGRRNEFYSDFEHRTHAGSINLNGIVETGPISHNLIMGIDIRDNLRRRPKNARETGTQFNINIYNPIYGQVGIATQQGNATYSQYEKIRTIGTYLQDNMNLTDELIFVSGLRYEYYDQYGGRGQTDFKVATDQHDGKLLYNLGLVYLLTPEWSVYTSYSQSFNPQSSISAEVSSSLPPEEGESVELGTKFQNNNITATAAIFNIDKKNVSYSTTINGVSTLLIAGKQRSRGFEFDLSGRVTNGLNVGSSYTYTKATTKEDIDTPWRAGKQLEATPKHQASLFANYDFSHIGLKGFRVGGGARYFGSWQTYNMNGKTGTIGTPYKLPHAVTYDAFISYTTKISGYETNFALNVKNLTDKLYFTTAASGTQAENVIPVIPGYARQIMLTASVKF
ncbi:TonB-dependent siderophore receptor [Campylobacter gastrosuis]|uniref:TonB-dependent siderophore receptor n=1 Tax=Campylobacter gastrosuis TaxID=2974576 RepID=A0ABT7HSJ8_9BACT|nr:TonB-dependent siderophore receptor [Campylobacter gastrosuis]MDL0089393.1 TonB-dependent siderophore receptor [Campylobacter gastrosuis]